MKTFNKIKTFCDLPTIFNFSMHIFFSWPNRQPSYFLDYKTKLFFLVIISNAQPSLLKLDCTALQYKSVLYTYTCMQGGGRIRVQDLHVRGHWFDPWLGLFQNCFF